MHLPGQPPFDAPPTPAVAAGDADAVHPPADEPVVLEFRPQHRHHQPLLGARASWVLVGMAVVALLVFFGVSVHRIFPGLTWSDAPRIWAQALERTDLWTWQRWWLPALWALVLWVQWLWPRHLRLDISVQGIRQTHRMPLGLHHLFAQSWSVAWSDVRSVAVRQRLEAPYVQGMAMVDVELMLHKGRKRTIRPAFWFRPGDAPRARLRTPRGGFVLDARNPWLGENTQNVLAQAFDALPAVQALNRFGVTHRHRVAWTPGRLDRAFSQWDQQPEALAVFGGALLLFVVGFALMVAQPTLHLTAVLGWAARLAWGVGTLAVVAALLWAWRAARPRPSASAGLQRGALGLSALLWVCAVAFMAEPLLVHGTRWGRADGAVAAVYAVRSGQAAPVSSSPWTGDGAPQPLPTIDLPGEHSRLGWLRDGTEVTLTVVPGRWGVWTYDDTPLRRAADEQGIR